MRLKEHAILGPRAEGKSVTFLFNGKEFQGLEGEPIAVALVAQGEWVLRHNEQDGEPRSLYCGMGHCFECRVAVDGVPNLRACLTPLRQGIRVEG